MLSPRQKRDRLVRATDLDALSCRLSCSSKGYFSDGDAYIGDLVRSYSAHLHLCQGYTQLSAGRTLRSLFKEGKMPIINRGTYLRTYAVDAVVERFIASHTKCQIVSIGGGSDTRCFRVLEKHSHVVYTEIDFPESVKIKMLAIGASEKMQALLQTSALLIASREEFEALKPELHTPNYHLVGQDLRTLDSLPFLENIPTLVVSECVLCYLAPAENEVLLQFFQRAFASVSLVMYEPMALGDAFGRTMAQNLASRGINLLTFEEYPTLDARRAFLHKNGFQSVLATDLAAIGGYGGEQWPSDAELARVLRLEMIDEVEEIRLLLRHYCLVYAGPVGQVGELPWPPSCSTT